MIKAVLQIDIHETSNLLSGIMLLEAEILYFIDESSKGKTLPEGIPSIKELQESLVRTRTQKTLLENILESLMKAESKG